MELNKMKTFSLKFSCLKKLIKKEKKKKIETSEIQIRKAFQVKL